MPNHKKATKRQSEKNKGMLLQALDSYLNKKIIGGGTHNNNNNNSTSNRNNNCSRKEFKILRNKSLSRNNHTFTNDNVFHTSVNDIERKEDYPSKKFNYKDSGIKGQKSINLIKALFSNTDTLYSNQQEAEKDIHKILEGGKSIDFSEVQTSKNSSAGKRLEDTQLAILTGKKVRKINLRSPQQYRSHITQNSFYKAKVLNRAQNSFDNNNFLSIGQLDTKKIYNQEKADENSIDQLNGISPNQDCSLNLYSPIIKNKKVKGKPILVWNNTETHNKATNKAVQINSQRNSGGQQHFYRKDFFAKKNNSGDRNLVVPPPIYKESKDSFAIKLKKVTSLSPRGETSHPIYKESKNCIGIKLKKYTSLSPSGEMACKFDNSSHISHDYQNNSPIINHNMDQLMVDYDPKPFKISQQKRARRRLAEKSGSPKTQNFENTMRKPTVITKKSRHNSMKTFQVLDFCTKEIILKAKNENEKFPTDIIKEVRNDSRILSASLFNNFNKLLDESKPKTENKNLEQERLGRYVKKFKEFTQKQKFRRQQEEEFSYQKYKMNEEEIQAPIKHQLSKKEIIHFIGLAKLDGYYHQVKSLLRGNSAYALGFDWIGATALHVAIKNEDLKLAELLIDYNSNVDAKDLLGRTPIFFAVSNSNYEMVRLLLYNKANPWSNDGYDLSKMTKDLKILDLLKRGRRLKIMCNLIGDNKDSNFKDNYWETMKEIYLDRDTEYKKIIIESKKWAVKNE